MVKGIKKYRLPVIKTFMGMENSAKGIQLVTL